MRARIFQRIQTIPLQNSACAGYSVLHVAISGIKTVDFVIVIGLEALVPVDRTITFSLDTIFLFSQDTIKNDLLANILAVHFPPLTMSAISQLEQAFEVLKRNNEETLLCMYTDLNAKLKYLKYLSHGDHFIRWESL